MIRNVWIQNFKSLRAVSLEMGRLTMFVGPNASGKTSVLQAINQLCTSAARHVPQDMGLLKSWLSSGISGTVELAASYKDYAFRCYFPPRPLGNSNGSPFGPNHGENSYRDIGSDLHADNWKPWRPDTSNIDPLPRAVLLRLEASKLIPADPNPIDTTVMLPDGTGLHAALENMTLYDPDSWALLQENLCKIIPTMVRLRHTKNPNGTPHALLFDTQGARGLSASQVSEGTLLVLGLLAALYAADRPSVILLDDLDRGLHPRAQRDLIELLRGLLVTNPDLQIVATTHSPYLLDCIEPHEVRMTYLRDDGSTACDSLTNHPEFEKWKNEMDSGEMWSLFGEEWVAKAGVAG